MKKLIIGCFSLVFALLNLQADPLRVFIRASVETDGPGQHDHPRFLGEWSKLLSERGLQVDGAMNFPNAEQLDDTDVLVIYAAEGAAIRGEERARFENFLRRGGGLVVIHNGVCGDDPHWFKNVAGGAWEHGHSKWYEGEVGQYFVDTEHPISRGISNFDWDDEVYWDLHMHPDARVLSTSFHSIFVIAPQKWVFENTWEGGERPYRSFVTLAGHEYANFNKPHFRAILLRGIAWAGRREDVDEFCSSEELASLKYPEGGPTAPEKAAARLNVHPEFNVRLVASEPLVEKVISLDWCPQGRLWVAETPEYPGGRTIHPNDAVVKPYRGRDPERFSGKLDDRPPRDRISWLEDTTGDGIMDKAHVFYDQLELVTSLVFYKDGVIVAQAPDILWLRDTDGDGKADRVETLYTGFGTFDSHAVINNFRWGMDGWIYSAIGYSAGRPRSGDGERDFGRLTAGVIRFKPDGSALEQVASGSCNTWGFDFAPDGEAFYTTATCGEHFLHVVVPERILARGHTGGVRASAVLPEHQRVFPAIKHTRPAYVQVDWVGMFTAASGSTIYDGGAWPHHFHASHFVSDPTVHLVHHELVLPKGSTYVAQREPGREEEEFITSDDLWFSPIHARVGPDGALYVVDFYNQTVIHNDTRGNPHGARNASTRPDRDHHFARLWRIQHKEPKALPHWKLHDAASADLAKLLDHPNGWVRGTAQRLLTERADPASVAALENMARSGTTAYGRINALWTLENIRALKDGLLTASMGDKNPIVRKNALRLVADRESASEAKLNTVLQRLNDPDAQVRLQALIALGLFEPTPDVAKAVVTAWPKLDDAWLQSVAIGTAAREPLLYVQAALAANGDPAFVRHVVRLLAERGDAEQAEKLIALLAAAPRESAQLKRVALESLSTNLRTSVALIWKDSLKSAFQSFLASGEAGLAGAALPLIGRWDSQGHLSEELKPVVSELATELENTEVPDAGRIQIAANLLGVRHLNDAVIPAVSEQLRPGGSPELQRGVAEALGRTGDAAAGEALVQAFSRVHGAVRESVLAELLRRADWSRLLIQALAHHEIALNTLGPGHLHRLRTHPESSVATFAAETIDALRGPEVQEKDELIAQLTPEVLKPGNIERGREVFEANCAACHVFQDKGGDLAPNLTGMGLHGPVDLLTHTVDPNRLVEPNFISYSVETKDDEVYDGIIVRENARELVLRNASGTYTLLQADIRERWSTGLSIMPEGYETLGAEALRDLIAYLCSDTDKYQYIDLRPAFTADSTRGIYGNRTQQSLLFREFGSVKAGEVPFDIVHPSRSPNGNNLIILKGRNGITTEYPERVEVNDVNIRARKLHFLGGVGGWAWPFGGDSNKDLPVAKITVTHANGATESWTLLNGVHLADYNGNTDVPGSQRAPRILQRGQIRTFSLELSSRSPIVSIAFESFDNLVAPTFAAITAELEVVH